MRYVVLLCENLHTGVQVLRGLTAATAAMLRTLVSWSTQRRGEKCISWAAFMGLRTVHLKYVQGSWTSLQAQWFFQFATTDTTAY